MLMKELPDVDDYVPIEASVGDVKGIDGIVKSAISPFKRRLGGASEFREFLQRL
jgi:hypothetical protein